MSKYYEMTLEESIEELERDLKIQKLWVAKLRAENQSLRNSVRRLLDKLVEMEIKYLLKDRESEVLKLGEEVKEIPIGEE